MMLRISLLVALIAGVAPWAIAQNTDTVPQYEELSAELLRVPVTLSAGQGLEVTVTLDSRSLVAGRLDGRWESGGDGRVLLTGETAWESAAWIDDSFLSWQCAETECEVTAEFRLDALTDVAGEIAFNAHGRATADTLPPDAALATAADEPQLGPAATVELVYTFVEHDELDSGLPAAALIAIEYDLGDPSDDIELAVRPMLGNVTIDGEDSPPPIEWAQGLGLANTATCPGDCRGTALVRLGPSQFTDLEYQILAHSDRPGVAALATASAVTVPATRHSGIVMLTADDPVLAIPITVSGSGEGLRLLGAASANGEPIDFTLRRPGEASFEPAAAWVEPEPGAAGYELAISAAAARSDDVTVSWVIALYDLSEPASAALTIGDPAATGFVTGATGDPNRNPIPPESVPPWALFAGLLVAGAGGAALYRRRSRSS